MMELFDRTVALEGTLDADRAGYVLARVAQHRLKDPRVAIRLEIDSSGGDARATLALVDELAHLESPIETRARGPIAGPAVLVLASGKRPHRSMPASATLALAPIAFAPGEERLEAFFFDELARLVGKSAPELLLLHDHEGTLSADEARAWGFVDELS